MLDKIKKFFSQDVKEVGSKLVNKVTNKEESLDSNSKFEEVDGVKVDKVKARLAMSKALQIKIDEEKEEARSLTKEGKVNEAAVQWDIVEELSAEASNRSDYEKFCDENPSDRNCKMYDI